MFSTPRKAINKLRVHPYLSPLKLFGLAETPTVTPVSGPGGPSFSPSIPPNSRISTTPTPRKRYGAYSPLNPRPLRPVGRGYHHRSGIRRTTSRQSFRLRRPIHDLKKNRAAREAQFAGLARTAFDTADQSRRPLTHEDRIFLTELANLGATRRITTGLAEARAAADRAAELAPVINAEREAKAQASLAREKEQRRAFARQREAETAAKAAAEKERLDRAKLQSDRLFVHQQRLIELRKQRQREDALHREKQQKLADQQRFQHFFQEARPNDQLREQAERDRLACEQEVRRHDEEVARLREEGEAYRRMEEERTQLENERLAQRQKDIQTFIDATLRFQQEAHDQFQREQAARLQAEREARTWFEAAQKAEMAANYARAQCNSRGFVGVDVSMMDASFRTEMDTSFRTEMGASFRTEMDASMRIDMDASMRTAAPYSPPPSPPPPPPPLTVADRFALYECKWAALKSDVPVLSFEVLPWPTLHDVSVPADITDERMVEFFFNPKRPGYNQKTQKELSRIELLRWHPDKFLGKVLGKVDEAYHAMVSEAVGQVSRFLVLASAS